MRVAFRSLKDINERIMKQGMGKNSFARKAGLNHTTTWMLFTGKRHPSPETAKKICEALDMEFDDIFTIEYENEGMFEESI